MTDQNALTVEDSLDALIDALGKAADDYRAAHATITRMRAALAARNTAVPRAVIKETTRALDHLRGADQALSDVIRLLEETT